MEYQLQLEEPVPEGMRRVACEEIDAAVENLERANAEIEQGIHEARKCFKKIRAVLRLARGELGVCYTNENQWFRDAGRRLSKYRDLTAGIEALQKLRQKMEGEVDPEVFDQAGRILEGKRARAMHADSDLAECISALNRALRNKRRDVGSWPLQVNSFEALAYGLRKTYKRGRKAMPVAYAELTPEAFHEWRKRVKYHWHHCCILERIWPKIMKKRADESHTLATLLGDYHDLDVLRETVFNEVVPNAGCDMGNLLRVMDGRQAALRYEAWPLGYRVYAEAGEDFVIRMRRYWEAWRT